ncbi:MAG: PaaI family thioesterase [Methyloligellaceae bacterium]
MYPYSDAEIENRLKTNALSNGFNAWLSVELLAAGNGQLESLIEIRPDMTQHHGFVHGGIVGAFADNSCAWAAATVAGDVVTSSYTIQFLAPAVGDRLRAKAKTIKAGKRNISVETQVFCENNEGESKLVAIALASIANV